ncbi:Ribulose-bisphosphate carboxylase [Zostera marina]|uniref:Ribulose bisphosphate carboxylase small subunit, chloroplastic n=1 Tax=Zostera marina TaxID=29655 RepID=A0A0K9P837_ZOSMR|nr:Ribulose-bisphosphate carboxylase [Zostera marina]
MSTRVLSSTFITGSPQKYFPSKESFSSGLELKRSNTGSNGSRISCCMKTWNPINNKKFEALSYLPPLSAESIGKEVAYMVSQNWIPCLEFDEAGHVRRENSRMPGYYDGRYWTLWKLPMFGCSEPSMVLQEIDECKKTYPNAYIRLLAFDNKKQSQCMSFVIHKPLLPRVV